MYPQAPLQTLWHYTGRHLSTPYGVARKLLTGACLAKIRLEFWLWFSLRGHVGGSWVYPQAPLQTLWHYAGRHLSTPYGVARKLLTGALLGQNFDSNFGCGSSLKPCWRPLGVPTSTSADALALRWPTFKHSLWGSAETTD